MSHLKDDQALDCGCVVHFAIGLLAYYGKEATDGPMIEVNAERVDYCEQHGGPR